MQPGVSKCPSFAALVFRKDLAHQKTGYLASAVRGETVPLACRRTLFAGGFSLGRARCCPTLPGTFAESFLVDDSVSSMPGTVTWSRRACTSCDGTRYRIVVSSDLCPIQCCTVRTSKPARSARDANVDRNVFRSNLVGSSPARPATALQRSSMWYSRFPFGEENTKLQPARRGCALSKSINWTGIGTSRSSQRLG